MAIGRKLLMQRLGRHRYSAILAGALLLAAMLIGGGGLAQTGWTGTRLGPAGKDLNAVYFADTKRGWIGGDGGFLSYTGDGGHSWAEQPVSTSHPINDVYFSGKDTGFLLSGNEILGTNDGGRTWKTRRRLLPSEFDGAEPELYSVRFVGSKQGWVVGSASRQDVVVDSIVLFTKDAGISWQRQVVPTREELIHLDFVNDKHGWIVGASGTILHTANGGESWIRQNSDVKTTLYHSDFRDEKLGWAVGEKGTILRTINGGNNWEPVESNVRTTLLSVQFVSEDQGWVVGRGGVILRSEDGGRTWIRQAAGIKQNLYALFMGKKMGWAVGGDGMVLQYER
ncbi:MAG: YCF48-related protein [Pyrinomonadaceae bacterium]